MKRDEYRVFSKKKIAGLELKNRLVRSATFEAAMTKDGRTTDEMLGLYRDLAEGGVGTIITGYMAVMLKGKPTSRATCVYSDSHTGEIAKIADVIHDVGNDCKTIAQIVHVGRQVYYHNRDAECVGPSGTPSPVLMKKARALSTEEVGEITERFADAIVRVKEAGFDGVQLHGAHGYLLSSFLSPYTNHRTDQYGGSVGNRANIVREIVQKARDRVGDFPILIKMNCDDQVVGGIDTDGFPELAMEVAGTGVDAIEVSGGMLDCLARTEEELGFPPLPLPEARTRIGSPDKQSYFLKYVEKLDLDIPVILVGGNRNIERLEEIMNRGKVDFLALCRPLINEPDLPNRWLEGRGSNNSKCVSCNACVMTLARGPVSCMLKGNRLKYKIVKREYPVLWKTIFK